MVKAKLQVFTNGTKVAVSCLVVLYVVLAILFYLKIVRLNEFLKGVYQVRIIHSYSGDKVQKMVYYSDVNSSKIILTNNTLDPQNAIELPFVPEIDFTEVSVPFYKNNYFVIRYGIGEGGSDFLIFDQNGKIITRALIQNTDKSQLLVPSPNFYEPLIIGPIGYDAIMNLKFVSNPPDKDYYASFDITTGKLKSFSSQ